MAKRIKPSYRRGIEFIALNDEPDERDEEVMCGWLSVVTLSEAFGVDASRVARDVVRVRVREGDLRSQAWVQ